MSVIYFTVTTLFFSIFVVTVNEGKNDEKIVFPGASTSNSEKSAHEIPLNLIRQLNEVSSDEELLQNLFQSDLDDPFMDVTYRMGSKNGEGKFQLRAAKMARCLPELQVVCLRPNNASATFYYPSCTRVERCGGCCSHRLLSCQPVEKSIIPMSVVVADYLGGNKLQFRGKKIMEVEQHTKCRCECKIRPESCTRYQRYNTDKCQCECANSDEEKRCDKERIKKLWNSENCSCMCREELECSTGFYFDPFTCSCTPYRIRKIQNFLHNTKTGKLI